MLAHQQRRGTPTKKRLFTHREHSLKTKSHPFLSKIQLSPTMRATYTKKHPSYTCTQPARPCSGCWVCSDWASLAPAVEAWRPL